MDHRQAFVVSRVLMGVCLISAVLMLLLLKNQAVAMTLGAVAWLSVIGMFLVLRLYAKCPHCGKSLRGTGSCPEKCPHCEGTL